MITEIEQDKERDALFPVLIRAQFAVDGRKATLHMRGTGPIGLMITTIHESLYQTVAHDFEAHEEAGITTAHDQESVTILVRHEGHIIASGVYEVSLRQAERIGVLLVPCVEQGIVLAQHEDNAAAVIDAARIITTSLVAGLAEVAQ